MKTYEKRSDMPAASKWAVEDIYANDAAWEKDFEGVETLIEEVSRYKGRIAESAETLHDMLKSDERLDQLLSKLYLYAKMHQDENTRDSHYQGMTTRIQSVSVRASEATSYIVPELMAADETIIRRYLDQNPNLIPYQHAFESMWVNKPHILSEPEEKILAMVGDLARTPQQVFGMLNNADLQFPEVENEKGERVKLTHSNYVPLMESQDERVRKDAFTSLYKTYEAHKHSLAAMLEGEVKKNVFYSRVRKHADSRSASLSKNHIDPVIYDGLVTGVHDNFKPLHDYVALRAKNLKQPILEPYNLYLPLVKEVDQYIPFEEAFDIVIEALKPLGEEYIAIAKRARDERWIDVYENEGKRSGAYSWGTYGTKPYILLNYQGTLDNMFTLAHELGHSMHSYLTWENQPYHYGHYSIFLAEVASTTNEALLTEYLLEKETNPAKRAYIINHQIDQFRTTLYRQTMFAEFEHQIHTWVEAGNGLTADELTKRYGDLHKLYYGNQFNNDTEICLEWSRIPHFYYNFYVFQYATGFSAAIALSQRILKDGDEAVKQYLDFLKAGCSDYPVDVLKGAGADLSNPKTITDALNVFGEKVALLEALLLEL